MERILLAAGKEPLIRGAVTSRIMDDLQRLWQEREVFLNALDRLPRTICHRDLVPTNLLTRVTTDGHVKSVAVDWAFVGIGPVGEDLPPLVLVPPPSETGTIGPEQLDEPLFTEYVQGLMDAGWRGQEQLARLGYIASAALRYGCLTPAIILLHALDPTLREAMEGRHGRPIDALLEREAQRFSFALGLADQGRNLIADPDAFR